MAHNSQQFNPKLCKLRTFIETRSEVKNTQVESMEGTSHDVLPRLKSIFSVGLSLRVSRHASLPRLLKLKCIYPVYFTGVQPT